MCWRGDGFRELLLIARVPYDESAVYKLESQGLSLPSFDCHTIRDAGLPSSRSTYWLQLDIGISTSLLLNNAISKAFTLICSAVVLRQVKLNARTLCEDLELLTKARSQYLRAMLHHLESYAESYAVTRRFPRY
jgi:hypothetical protein